MPQPGDPCPGLMADAGRCWRMVYDHNLQATHCANTPSWSVRWFSLRGNPRWRLSACADHVDGLTSSYGVQSALLGVAVPHNTCRSARSFGSPGTLTPHKGGRE